MQCAVGCEEQHLELFLGINFDRQTLNSVFFSECSFRGADFRKMSLTRISLEFHCSRFLFQIRMMNGGISMICMCQNVKSEMCQTEDHGLFSNKIDGHSRQIVNASECSNCSASRIESNFQIVGQWGN